MKRLLKSLAMDIMALRRSYPTELTDRDAIQALMNRLAPVHGGMDLIRLGPRSDGGYLVPDDLHGIEACFSPGVGLVSGFERQCAELGMKVFLADHCVQRPAQVHERFHHTRKHIGVTTNDQFITIDDWVAGSLPQSREDLLLQIDIEGYEYETFLGMSDALMRRFRIIVAEFHDLDEFWNKPFFRLASRVFDKILQSHTCVHIHPNNCSGSVIKEGLSIPRVAEFTFLRNDRIRAPAYITAFPHPLDADNCQCQQLLLPRCWYRQHG